MEKFKNIKSIPAYLPLMNIDTDKIIPKQFLKTIKRSGLGKSLFYEMRFDEKGNPIKAIGSDSFVDARGSLQQQSYQSLLISIDFLRFISSTSKERG